MANSVFIWIDRADGGREANVGTFQSWAKDKNGQTLHGSDGQALMDELYVAQVIEEIGQYNGENCADVLADLLNRKERKNDTGVAKQLVTMIIKIGANIVERQRRATNDTLRARALAEIELQHLTVFVRED